MEIKEILSNKSTLIGFITCVLRSPKEFSVEQVLDIYMKRPSLEIRTYNGWKEIGRQVCLGEKGVGFYDPNSTLKNKQTYVFDVSQTKGHYRKKPEFTYEEFNKVFYQVNDISLIVSNHSIEEYKEEIAKKLEIKETKNATDRRIIIEESGESQQERRVDNRTIDGDRGISQEGVRTSIGERDDTIRTIEDTNQSIWVTSRSVSQIEQLYEVYGTSSEWSDGTRVDSDRGESDEVRRPDVLGVSTTEERNVSRESDAQSSVYSRSERESVQGNNSSVRDELSNYILTEEDFISRSPKERFKDNVEAIKVVKTLKKEDRLASIEEQKILSKYVGWGGLQEAFNASNASWSNEYKVLKELLTTDEYEFAQGSVLNAHFTSKEIIDGIYAGLRHLGVKKGKVLEPSCGTGNFIGCKPNDMEFSFDGVELDTITAQIAQALYPKESIKQSGFEDCKIKDGTYDIVIGNVPFGDYRVYDNDYNRYKFVIHDYFIAKSLDKLRAGGIMAIITGKGTLDKQNSSARRYFAERANLLGAFRLPNTAFKGNAGTEAVADILFFQKREENIPSAELAPQTIEWIRSGIVEENVPALNDYFVEHKENVLGEFKLVSGRFGMDRTVVPSSEELSKDLEKIIEFLPKDIYKEPSKIEEKKKEENSSIGVLNSEEMDSLGIKNYSMFLYNNRVYIRETDTFVLSERKILQGELSGKVLERVKGYIALREQVRKVIDIQCDNCSDDLLKQEQQELNSLYDNFVKKYGYLNEVVNDKYFREDLDYPLVCSVEDYDNEEKVGKKCAIFNTRTIKNVEKKTYVEDTHEALALCKNELGEVDLHYIEKLTKLSTDTILRELKGEIFQLPEILAEDISDKKYDGWVSREDYLSGDVVAKLEMANFVKSSVLRKEYESEEEKQSILIRLESNIKELEQVQPKKLTAGDIKVRLGATWIDERYYNMYLCYLINNGRNHYGIEIKYNTFNGQYGVQVPSWLKHTAEATNIWGTARMNAVDIFECALNNRPPTVWDKVQTNDGKEKRVVNKAETAVVREKVRQLNEEFSNWLWKDEYRRKDLEETYNRVFNSSVLPEYKGRHLTFDGMNAALELRDHQKDAVARISTGRNVLLHHSVGAGKTFEIIAGAMKLRQYGIAKKPMVVVPKPLVGQWARDIKLLYPNAKVLVATEEAFEKQNRRRFVSRIATGDWDMVVIAESQFRRIPVSQQRQLQKLGEVIDRIKQSIVEYNDRNYNAHRSLTVKQLTATLKKKETKYKELQDKINKVQDSVIEFEKLGVDYLFVDEAHLFKNKEIETSMSNVAGITTGGSERAYDLEMKIDFISEQRGGDKGIVFATGTPISNSMAEMYTMQSYLAKEDLQNKGVLYFDAWASTFGEVVTSWELNTSGSGVKPKMRFARFVNLPELQKMYRKFADVKTADMLNLPVPEVIRNTITIPATEQILAYNDEIIERGERIERGGVDPTIDNMLKLTSDGKKLALDARCLDENAVDEEDTKINACVNKVFDIYEEHKEEKLTQAIFCDQSTPKVGVWSVYQDIKDKLVALGVKEEEIAFIHDADTDAKKEKLYEELNAGTKRVLIGSTQKCGVGANFQKKLKALHHLDVPYRPADMEQREGRIIRQGNKNSNVEIYNYITEKTFDSYSYQILENKQRFISQINKGDMSLREAGDIDEQTMSFAQIKAIATANPDFLRQMELIQVVKELRMLKSKYYENIEVMQRKLTIQLPKELSIVSSRLENVEKDIAEKLVETPKLYVAGVLYDESSVDKGESYRVKGAEALNLIFRAAYDGQTIGEYGEFKLVASKSMMSEGIVLKGYSTYNIETGLSALGNLTKIENTYKDIPKLQPLLAERKESIQQQMEELSNNYNKPWEREQELRVAERELVEIEERLQINKEEVVEYVEETNEKKEQKNVKSKEHDDNINE